MTRSLNEVAAMIGKAARGAGYDWGMTEEAAKAARWLCAQGLDGCGVFAALLNVSRKAQAKVEPGRIFGDAPLCPLSAGTALSDFASTIPPEGMTIAGVLQPLVILPFAADITRQTGTVLHLTWPEAQALTDGDQLQYEGPVGACAAADIAIRPGARLSNPNRRVTRATPSPEDWATLSTFAARTYAPATEASRHLGAGAGTTDND